MSDYKDFNKYEYHGLRGFYCIQWSERDGKKVEWSEKKEWKVNNNLVKTIDFVNGICFIPKRLKKWLNREKMNSINYPRYEELMKMYPNGEYKNVEWGNA